MNQYQSPTEYTLNDPHVIAQHEEIQKRFSKIVFKRTEISQFHNSYENERQLLQCIRSGNRKGLQECWENSSNPKARPEQYGTLAAANNLRNVRNLSIVAIALASRAAINGGVAPELAFSLCDSYIQRIEELNDSRYIMGIVWYAESDFTEMVAKAANESRSNNSNASYYVTRCKDYIMAHLHDRITVSEIAESLHLNANYLSGLFHQTEGCTILAYIQQQKAELICNMLTYSDYSYDQIAAYLGYSSASNMNTHFKKITGMTLHEFRQSRYSTKHEFTSQ